MSLILRAVKAVQLDILPFCRSAQPILQPQSGEPNPRLYWLCAGFLDVLFGISHSVANPPINGAFLPLAAAFFAVTLRRLQALAISQGALPLPEWGFAVDAFNMH